MTWKAGVMVVGAVVLKSVVVVDGVTGVVAIIVAVVVVALCGLILAASTASAASTSSTQSCTSLSCHASLRFRLGWACWSPDCCGWEAGKRPPVGVARAGDPAGVHERIIVGIMRLPTALVVLRSTVSSSSRIPSLCSSSSAS